MHLICEIQHNIHDDEIPAALAELTPDALSVLFKQCRESINGQETIIRLIKKCGN
jgi:hypothetical protein